MSELSIPIDYLAVGETGSTATTRGRQNDLYRQALEQFGPSVERLTVAYEADPEKRRDLSQEIQFQLWRSFKHFDGRCSLRTWVYRVAHHVATTHVIRERRNGSNLVSLEDLERVPETLSSARAVDRRLQIQSLTRLIQTLKPLDRQVIVCYLEEMDASAIGEVTGLAPANVATRIHRIKGILARRFQMGGSHA